MEQLQNRIDATNIVDPGQFNADYEQILRGVGTLGETFQKFALVKQETERINDDMDHRDEKFREFQQLFQVMREDPNVRKYYEDMYGKMNDKEFYTLMYNEEAKFKPRERETEIEYATRAAQQLEPYADKSNVFDLPTYSYLAQMGVTTANKNLVGNVRDARNYKRNRVFHEKYATMDGADIKEYIRSAKDRGITPDNTVMEEIRKKDYAKASDLVVKKFATPEQIIDIISSGDIESVRNDIMQQLPNADDQQVRNFVTSEIDRYKAVYNTLTTAEDKKRALDDANKKALSALEEKDQDNFKLAVSYLRSNIKSISSQMANITRLVNQYPKGSVAAKEALKRKATLERSLTLANSRLESLLQQAPEVFDSKYFNSVEIGVSPVNNTEKEEVAVSSGDIRPTTQVNEDGVATVLPRGTTFGNPKTSTIGRTDKALARQISDMVGTTQENSDVIMKVLKEKPLSIGDGPDGTKVLYYDDATATRVVGRVNANGVPEIYFDNFKQWAGVDPNIIGAQTYAEKPDGTVGTYGADQQSQAPAPVQGQGQAPTQPQTPPSSVPSTVAPKNGEKVEDLISSSTTNVYVDGAPTGKTQTAGYISTKAVTGKNGKTYVISKDGSIIELSQQDATSYVENGIYYGPVPGDQQASAPSTPQQPSQQRPLPLNPSGAAPQGQSLIQ